MSQGVWEVLVWSSSPHHPVLQLRSFSGQPSRGLKAEEGCPEPPESLAHPVLYPQLGQSPGLPGKQQRPCRPLCTGIWQLLIL